MIKIKMLSGPFAEKERIMPSDMDAAEFMHSVLEHGWRWEVDYSEASYAEIYIWLRQDIACRIVRALFAGRTVRFLDYVWRKESDDPEIIKRQIGEIEDTIADAGFMITLERDDEKGVVIGARGPEPQ